MAKRTVVELPIEVAEKMKEIGIKITKHRQAVDTNYKRFAESHGINNMTLWRIQNGEDFKMSSLLQVLIAIGISPEEFFTGIK